ncbi:hypothetical protein A6X21_10700 [Planctopirus hydrillae]|uniref:Uncharacterized protein n=1 Tax=Planctopirus hydrillae TaxID=1841610 RepID=A0A1C3E6U1_9PLAN|nr:hypothetical protein A6X21_10700 [Planctopirus hydrillae]
MEEVVASRKSPLIPLNPHAAEEQSLRISGIVRGVPTSPAQRIQLCWMRGITAGNKKTYSKSSAGHAQGSS